LLQDEKTMQECVGLAHKELTNHNGKPIEGDFGNLKGRINGIAYQLSGHEIHLRVDDQDTDNEPEPEDAAEKACWLSMVVSSCKQKVVAAFTKCGDTCSNAASRKVNKCCGKMRENKCGRAIQCIGKCLAVSCLALYTLPSVLGTISVVCWMCKMPKDIGFGKAYLTALLVTCAIEGISVAVHQTEYDISGRDGSVQTGMIASNHWRNLKPAPYMVYQWVAKKNAPNEDRAIEACTDADTASDPRYHEKRTGAIEGFLTSVNIVESITYADTFIGSIMPHNSATWITHSFVTGLGLTIVENQCHSPSKIFEKGAKFINWEVLNADGTAHSPSKGLVLKTADHTEMAAEAQTILNKHPTEPVFIKGYLDKGANISITKAVEIIQESLGGNLDTNTINDDNLADMHAVRAHNGRKEVMIMEHEVFESDYRTYKTTDGSKVADNQIRNFRENVFARTTIHKSALTEANQRELISSKQHNIVRVISLHATAGYIQGYSHPRANLVESKKVHFRKFFTEIEKIMNNKIHGVAIVRSEGKQRIMPTDVDGNILNPLVVFQMDYVTEDIVNMAKRYQDAYYAKIATVYNAENDPAENRRLVEAQLAGKIREKAEMRRGQNAQGHVEQRNFRREMNHVKDKRNNKRSGRPKRGFGRQ